MWTWPTPILDSWFVYGDSALDIILGTDYSDDFQVCFKEIPPTHHEVLGAGLNARDLPMTLVNEVRAPSFAFQRIWVLPDESLFDAIGWAQLTIEEAFGCLSAAPLQTELTDEVVLQAARSLTRYPQIELPPIVRGYLRARLNLLAHYGNQFIDTSALLELYTD